MFVLPTFGLGVIASPTEVPFVDLADSLVIDVYDTESQVFALTSVTNYTIVHAKDTDNLYVWDGSNWVLFNNN
jgi:hypothetical protein